MRPQPHRTRHRVAVIVLVGGLAFAAIGCSGTTSSSTAGISGEGTTATPALTNTVTVHALDTLRFDQNQYEADAGSVTIDYINDGSIPHTLAIEGRTDLALSVAAHGNQDRATIDLPAGTYVLFCTEPGHREAGMHATLVVR